MKHQLKVICCEFELVNVDPKVHFLKGFPHILVMLRVLRPGSPVSSTWTWTPPAAAS